MKDYIYDKNFISSKYECMYIDVFINILKLFVFKNEKNEIEEINWS